jgi:putative hemolysin
MKQQTGNEQYVDLEKSIRESDSKLLKKLPRFVINRLKKVIHQEELNVLLTKNNNVSGLAFLSAVIKDMNLTVEVYGKENLPENGRCFFAANHPFGILDGLLLTHTVASAYGQLTAIANDAFMLIPQLRPFITEVNVYGSSGKERIRVLNKMYASELPITHFPAGEVSRVYNHQIQDAPWQKSFIKKAIENQRNIVPIYFEGVNSKLFYTIFKMRRALGIDLNLELILLPREFFKKRNQTIKVHIGKPVAHTMFTPERTHEAWAQYVRATVYALAPTKG